MERRSEEGKEEGKKKRGKEDRMQGTNEREISSGQRE